MSTFRRRVGSLFASGAKYNTGTGKLDLTKSLPLRTVQNLPWASTITPDVSGGEVIVVGALEGNTTINSVASPIAGQAMELHFTQGSPARSVTFSADFQQPTGSIVPSTPGARWMVRFRSMGVGSTRKWYLESSAAADGRFTFFVEGWRGLITPETAGAATTRLVNHTDDTWTIDRWGIDATTAPSGGPATVTYGINGATNSGSFQLTAGTTNIWYETGDLPTFLPPGSYLRAWLTTVNGAQNVNFTISGHRS